MQDDSSPEQAAARSIRTPTATVHAVVDHLRSSLWPVPVLCIAVALGLGVALPWLDHAVDEDLGLWGESLLFGGGPAAARTVLDAVASSLITVTALTFSLTVVTLQLASSQYSPRLLRTFARDRFVHWTLGVLLGTFLYSLTILRTVRSPDEGDPFVPRVAVTTSYVLAVLSVVSLVLFLAHLAREIRAETILLRVRTDASTTVSRVLDRRDDEEASRSRVRHVPDPPDHAVTLLAASSGFVTDVDETSIARATGAASAFVRLDAPPGTWVVEGTPIGHLWSAGAAPLPEQDVAGMRSVVDDAVCTGPERTAVDDVAFGLRQLTDVAVKALSPGINDPTTAIHALDHGATLLTEIARHDPGPTLLGDHTGGLYLTRPDLAELLDLVVSGPRRYGAADPDVLARVLRLLGEVAWCLPEDGPGRDAVRRQVLRTTRVVAAQPLDDEDRRRLRTLAAAVLGPGADQPELSGRSAARTTFAPRSDTATRSPGQTEASSPTRRPSA